jgi:hypothetical protein
MPDATKLDILSAPAPPSLPPGPSSNPSHSPTTFRTAELMHAHERENWLLDLKKMK